MESLETLLQRAANGGRLTQSEAAELYHKAPIAALGKAAAALKVRKNGDKVYYNRNFHLEPTNVCLFNCKFCSYRRTAGDPDAWDYSIEELIDQVRARSQSGATEIHIVGGVHPHHDLWFYTELIRRVKEIMPQVTVKAFTAIELSYMIRQAGLSLEEGLKALIEAGMQAIPGGGAEIFNDALRRKICGEKGSAEEWLEVHRMAHTLGLTTNATILYGHIETLEDRLDHLARLRTLQDETGGFNAFIPLKYRSQNNSMGEIGEVSIVEDMRMIALSRLFLDNFPHIKAYWPMLGKETTEIALCFGADDIDGTIDDSTRIYSMAGADDLHPRLCIDEIHAMASRTGCVAVERDTFYHSVERS